MASELVVVDTVAAFGRINLRDHWYQRCAATYNELTNKGARFVLPRIAYVEVVGHINRINANPLQKMQARDRLLKNFSDIPEHTPEDFAWADAAWLRHLGRKLDYPDLLIAATAKRLNATAIWTYDQFFGILIQMELPGVDIAGMVP